VLRCHSVPTRVFAAFACIIGLVACSSDDEGEENQGRYADIVEWRCFEGADCWCPGLTAGNEASSSEPRVETCSYTTCFVYHPAGDSESWHCSCGPDGYAPESRWTAVESVPVCPPE
jgi:hypothetical protein